MRISDWSSDVCSSDLDGFSTPAISSWRLFESNVRRVATKVSTFESHVQDSESTIRNLRLVVLTYRHAVLPARSDELRVGKACVRTCRTRWPHDHKQTKNDQWNNVHTRKKERI